MPSFRPRVPRCVVLSISQDKPHPLAARSVLSATRALECDTHDRIESIGDLIVWTIHSVNYNITEDENEMVVINWKTGAIVWVSEHCGPPIMHRADLSSCAANELVEG